MIRSHTVPKLVTSFPSSSTEPYDGQEVFLSVPPASGVGAGHVRHARYNAAVGAWQYIGNAATLQQTQQGDFLELDYTWHAENFADKTWWKIADITFPSATFEAMQIEVEHFDTGTNFGAAIGITPTRRRFVVSAEHRAGGAATDTGLVQGPTDDYVRLVKTSPRNYQLQVRQAFDYHDFEIRAHVTSRLQNSPATRITWVDNPVGGATSTGTIYTGGWINLPFINGWQDYAAGAYGTCQYYRDLDGWVHLKGLADGGSKTAIIMAVLPVGCRPSGTRLFPSHHSGNEGRLDIDAGGNIVWQVAGATGYCSLEGIRFMAANV